MLRLIILKMAESFYTIHIQEFLELWINENPIETIKKLSELKENGIITQEEFEAKKAELLAKI